MVGLLTFGNRKFESLDSVMRQAITPLHEATQKLLPLADQDSQAFSDYLVRRDRGSRGIGVLKLFHIFLLPMIGCTETASENRRAEGKVLWSHCLQLKLQWTQLTPVISSLPIQSSEGY